MTNQIANLKLIEVLLNSEISDYRIEEKTGVSRSTIGKIKNGKSSIGNLTLNSAIALSSFAENQIIIKAGELLDKMKNSSDFEYLVYAGNKEEKNFLTNNGTGNLKRIYKDSESYGVYDEEFIDSRTHTDKEIKAALIKILSEGIVF